MLIPLTIVTKAVILFWTTIYEETPPLKLHWHHSVWETNQPSVPCRFFKESFRQATRKKKNRPDANSPIKWKKKYSKRSTFVSDDHLLFPNFLPTIFRLNCRDYLLREWNGNWIVMMGESEHIQVGNPDSIEFILQSIIILYALCLHQLREPDQKENRFTTMTMPSLSCKESSRI